MMAMWPAGFFIVTFVFVVVFCYYPISAGHLTWRESVISHNVHLFTHKASLYRLNCFESEAEDYSVRLHERNTHNIQFTIPFIESKLVIREHGSVSHPLSRYIFAMRVYYADKEESKWLLSATKKNCTSIVSETTSGPMLSFSTEQAVLKQTAARLKDLGNSIDPDGSEIFETTGELTFSETREYLRNLLASLEVAMILLRDLESNFIDSSRLKGTSYITVDELMTHYEQRIVSEIKIKRVLGNQESTTTEQQVMATNTATYFLNLYLRDSVVPFVNQLLSYAPRDTRLTAIPRVFVDQNVSYVVDGVTVNQRFFITDRQYARRNYTLSSSEVVTVSESLRIFFSVGGDKNLTMLLNNVHGYGAFSSIYMECLTPVGNADDIIDINGRGMAGQENTICTAIRTTLNVYNRVVVTPILALLPPSRLAVRPVQNQRKFDTPVQTIVSESASVNEALQRIKQYERTLSRLDADLCRKLSSSSSSSSSSSTRSQSPPRALILGLGAGELHMYLLQHFPCLSVDSVEISLDLFRTAQTSLGLDNGICSAFELRNGTFAPLKLDPVAADSMGEEDTASYENDSDDSVCRSNLFISDAWDYITHRNVLNARASIPSQMVQYDLIMNDVYDVRATSWNGESNTGVSIPFVDKAASDESLENVRSLLTPGVGLAVFHLHQDKQAKYYYDRISAVFGSDQVVAFAVSSNDMIIVAGTEGRFAKPTHMSNNSNNSSSSVATDITHAQQCDVDAEGRCTTQVDAFGLPLGGRHPCEMPLEFSQYAVQLAEIQQLRQEIALSSRLSLDCRDKREYNLRTV